MDCCIKLRDSLADLMKISEDIKGQRGRRGDVFKWVFILFWKISLITESVEILHNISLLVFSVKSNEKLL